MKVGDKVICIKGDDYIDLTIGNIYIVIDVETYVLVDQDLQTYYIENDNGVLGWYYGSRFKGV